MLLMADRVDSALRRRRLFLLRHVCELLTPEERRKLGLDQPPQMPYPCFFGGSGRRRGC